MANVGVLGCGDWGGVVWLVVVVGVVWFVVVVGVAWLVVVVGVANAQNIGCLFFSRRSNTPINVQLTTQ